ncbi:glucose 1-dehydrogenase [Bradyrhizobium diazoefficiens]|nr:glucose 1-dehydrogenase [Bradyrhizobium diazoefficiens]MBR0701974.1 glucose 1-dehydrogenase [Bradyrhizobium diazoefficiens]MBR0770397.1 glucose 1-dehydrogenase [Bradyrhizobium diazoefficiens]
MGLVDGKVAIITGGASGIGAATAGRLASEGARVLIADIDAEGEAVAERIRASGGTAQFRQLDVADERSWSPVIEATTKRYGRLDIMVANAGIVERNLITETSMAEWRRSTAINLDGVFLSVKFAIPAMTQSGGGSIIVISSVAGLRAGARLCSYSATKGGVRLFAKAAALECATLRNNIRVNSIHPGMIDTPIWRKTAPGANAPVDVNELARATAPIGRAGRPEEIADGVLYLASDLSTYVTGAELVIDGGLTAGMGIGRR